ncbi:MAG: single-stranded DNA-binding protein [Burkholderiales bacterium]
MLSVLASGTLMRDPEQRTSSAGKPFATGLMRVAAEDSDPILASLIAFSDGAVAALLALTKGDALSVAGRGKLTSWTKDGEQKHGLSVVVEQVLTLYAIEKRRDRARQSEEAVTPCP